MAFKSLYEAKVVKIHVLGRAADGDLKRPFSSGAGLFGGASPPPFPLTPSSNDAYHTASADPQTDKAAIEEAEKRIGTKEE
jgi:hypothetical protein